MIDFTKLFRPLGVVAMLLKSAANPAMLINTFALFDFAFEIIVENTVGLATVNPPVEVTLANA